MNGLTKYYTSPEFADLLKQHGVEIKTPFYWATLMFYQEVELFVKTSDKNKAQSISSGNSYPIAALYDTKPAYLLQQVVNWLPEQVKQYWLYAEKFEGIQNWGYAQDTWGIYGLDWYINPLPIEQLFTKLLEDGIITKETL